jgi:hypothetical protein
MKGISLVSKVSPTFMADGSTNEAMHRPIIEDCSPTIWYDTS